MSDTAALERSLRELVNAPSSLDRVNGGRDCPSEMELAAFVEGRLGAERAAEIRAHLSICGACLADALAALEELNAMAAEALSGEGAAVLAGPGSQRSEAPSSSSAEPQRGSGLRLLRSPAAWVGLAAAAILLVVLGPFDLGGAAGPDPRGTIQLARLAPVPARVPRGQADEAELAFREGLNLYLEERWEQAQVALDQAAELAPERADIALYRGSTALLRGVPLEALAPLMLAATAPDVPEAQAREARWQLAQAHLALADPTAARPELEALAGDGHRGVDAADVLERLRDLGW